MDDPTAPPLVLPKLFTHTHPPPSLIAQGAEAFLYRTHFLLPTHPCALKYRPSKPYRHPTLDKRLTRHRILSEARTLVKCRREGVSVPGVLALDAEGTGDAGGQGGWMMMEWIEGRTVRDTLVTSAKRGKDASRQGEAEKEAWQDGLEDLMGKIGKAVGRMHEVGVVHGDLTTSNMIMRPTSPPEASTLGVIHTNGENANSAGDAKPTEQIDLGCEIVLIDFGLSGQSIQDEDKAVDLYVLERAFASTHPEAEESFQEVLRGYGESYKGAKVVLRKLEDVRLRGRKRSMLG